MKLSAGRAVLSMSLLVAFAGLAPSGQAGQCSLAGTAGKYGFTLTGSVILPTGPVPIAAVGRATLGAAGNASGTESRSVGGGFADETFTARARPLFSSSNQDNSFGPRFCRWSSTITSGKSVWSKSLCNCPTVHSFP